MHVDEQGRGADVRRRAYFAATATILPFWLVDALIVGGLPWETLAIRLVWGGSFAVAGFLAGSTSERLLDGLAGFASAGSSAAMSALIWFTGAGESPYLFALPLLPLLIAVVETRGELPHLVSGGASVIGIALIGWHGNLGLGATAAWIAGIVAATAWASFAFRTMQVHRESALRAARLAAIGRLAAGVAHEINNPLAFAKANVAFVRDALGPRGRPADPADVSGALEETLHGLERIRVIVADLRTFARDEPEAPASHAPAEVVDEALRIASVRLRSSVIVVREVPEGLAEVPVLRGRLVQVIVNLLVNAADVLEGRTGGEVRLRVRAEPGWLRIEVEDNGPGVPPAMQKTLFQPFVTSKPAGKGVGLGLALSREYVERMGGTLGHEGPPGGGARFVIRLPAEDGPRRAA